MNTEKLFEIYPKTANVIKQWYLSKLLEELKDQSLPEDFKQHVREQGLDDVTIIRMVSASPRSLFDLFDSYKVLINIHCNWETFQYSVKIDKFIEGEFYEGYDDRKTAESAAITEAFRLLNDKL